MEQLLNNYFVKIMTKNFNEFITQFQENNHYYWKSTLKNAQYIFFSSKRKKF